MNMRETGLIINQNGQILLVVILVMIVALTVGLSVAARSITTTRSTSEEENSERAFSAAEAGIERALESNSSSTGSFTANNSSYTTTVTQLIGQAILVNNNLPILQDNAADIWLSTPPTYAKPWNGTLTVFWGQGGNTCQDAALGMALISGSLANPVETHYDVDPCTQRKATNNFAAAGVGSTIDGATFSNSFTIAVNNGLLLEIVPLYAPSTIGVACSGNAQNCTLPSQGTTITSVGKSDVATREIVTVKTTGVIPAELFSYSFLSP